MSCSKTRELMEPYLDGELQSAEIVACESHLADCAACRREHEERLRLRATVREQLDVAPPAGLEDSILREVSHLAAGEEVGTSDAPASRLLEVISELVRILRRPQVAPVAAAAVAVTLVLLVRWFPAPPGEPGAVGSRRAGDPFACPGDVVVLRYGEELEESGERRPVQVGGFVLDGSL